MSPTEIKGLSPGSKGLPWEFKRRAPMTLSHVVWSIELIRKLCQGQGILGSNLTHHKRGLHDLSEFLGSWINISHSCVTWDLVPVFNPGSTICIWETETKSHFPTGTKAHLCTSVSSGILYILFWESLREIRVRVLVNISAIQSLK